MRDSSIISLSSEFLMSRDNKKGIPLRIFFNLEHPTKSINEIPSYEILDGIAANSVNPQVLPPPFFSFFYYFLLALHIAIMTLMPFLRKLLTLICSGSIGLKLYHHHWLELGYPRDLDHNLYQPSKLSEYPKFYIPQEQWILLVDW